ncbi:hypothetical protein GPA10_13375 [Streptomyces sp. p1417]|uniref:Tetratricopeptide repeat-containing protein n=1 Tax=Streptomyces typhae TaxID=2681492 RepID=A0A6L6WU61_9ACTN|nr:hypothetical protein [Streptomyces typhae]
MPRTIDEILRRAAVSDGFADEDLDDLRQEVVRDVTAVLMFGIGPTPDGQLPTALARADEDLRALSTAFLHSGDAAAHLARIAVVPDDADGALRFGCLLDLARHPEGALWWWQFAAGAGNATAAYCLHLLHLRRGELRDADHWAHQALDLDADVQLAPTPFVQRLAGHTEELRKAVDRLKVDVVDGAQYHHPDQRLAARIEELADAAC